MIPVKLFFTFIFLCFLFACVPARKFEDQKAQSELYKAENTDCLQKLERTERELKSASERLTKLEKDVRYLRDDTASTMASYRKMKKMYAELDDLNQKLVERNAELLSSSSKEIEELGLDLAEKERELRKKELELSDLENSLNSERQSVEKLSSDLKEREERVNELESLISKKDSATNALKNKLTEALTGFDDDELTIEVKDGKVYVSISEKLLFKSGSINVDVKGKSALKKLAEVLKKQNDLDIIVEGHTDNVPYISGSGTIKDNWDLSALRATSVLKILISADGIEKQLVTASGRGEFHPVATNETPEGRSKNRRTEIVLSPDLKEIFQILESK